MIPLGTLAGQAAATAPFSPLDLGGVAYWFDASALSGYSDGDAISSVPDTSGNAHTGTATNLKYYSSTATTPSGGGCVGNPSANWNWTMPIFMAGGAGEAFAYYRPAPTGYRQLLQDFGTNPQACHWPWTDGYVYDGFGLTVRLTTASLGVTVDSANWYGVSVYSASADGYGIYRDDTLVWQYGGGAAVTTAWKASGNHQIGGDTRHLLAEIVIFDHKLTAGERTQMFDYFAAKHSG